MSESRPELRLVHPEPAPASSAPGTVAVAAGVLAGSVLVIAGLFWSLGGGGRGGTTETEVFRRLAATATQQPRRAGEPEGGPFGPWWIAAADADPVARTLAHPMIRSGDRVIAADRARVGFDVDADTFTLHLERVVFTVAAGDALLEEALPEGGLVELDDFELGPVPLNLDVIEDPRSTRPVVPVTLPNAGENR